ncbi:MAG: hypothetical protein ABIT76_01080 [Chthoniobacterales bacterium]
MNPTATTIAAVPASRATVEKDPLHWLRLAIYAYFLLWIFEGTLRKWILPGLSGPLLIIRDPVLVFIYFEAMRQKVFKLNGFLTFLLVLSTLSVIVSLGLFKAPPLYVIGFGIHSNFLHLPLIFLLPQVMTYAEIKKIGQIVLWLAPPMALLVALQFMSPSGARVNVGAGGEGKMLETAFDRIRPSGMFSFTNGLASYTAMLAAFLFHHLLEKNIFARLSFLLAAPSLLILVVMSGSRTVFALVGLQVLTVFVIWMVKPRFLQSSLKLVAISVAVIFLIGSVGALKIGMDVIITRFTSSGGVKEGFVDRFLGEFKKPIDAASRADAAGVGIGMGTNAASSMMYKMLRFNLGESEMDRIVMEMGPYLGLPYLLWRFAALGFIARMAWLALRMTNNTLPLLLTTACANDLVMGQFGQSTVLGYAVMAAGFALASVNRRDENLPADAPDPAQAPAVRTIPTYADRLRAEIALEAGSFPAATAGEPATEVIQMEVANIVEKARPRPRAKKKASPRE